VFVVEEDMEPQIDADANRFHASDLTYIVTPKSPKRQRGGNDET